VGSIAGDDTIFLALHSAEDAKAVKEAIWQILC
jgi:arginine repressor